MSWADELDEEPEPERLTGTDWLVVTTDAEQSRADRRMAKATRKLNRAERKYLRRKGNDDE